MAGMNPVELRIIIDAQNRASAILQSAMKDVKKFQKGVQDVGPDTAHMTGKFGDLGLAASGAAKRMGGISRAMLGFAGKAAGIVMIGAAIQRTAKAGALLESRIESLDGSFNEAMKRIRDLSEASNGAFSMPELVDAESKINAFNIGMKLTPKVLKNIQGRAAQMGISTTKALDDIILGLSRGSRKILDNVGLIVSQTEANKQYSRQLGKTVDDLSDHERRTAFLNLAMKELEKTTMVMTTSYSSSVESSSMMSDAWAEMQLAFAPLTLMFRPLAKMVMDIAKAVGSFLKPVFYALSLILTAILNPLAQVVGAFGLMFRALMELLKKGLSPLLGGLEKLLRIFGGLGIASQEANADNKKLAKSSEELADETKNLAAAWKALGAAVKTATEYNKSTTLPTKVRLLDLEIQRINLIKKRTGALTTDQKATLAFAKQDKKILETKINLLNVTKNYDKAFASINRSYLEGAITAADYFQQVGSLSEANRKEIALIGQVRDQTVSLIGEQALLTESTKKGTKARKESSKALRNWVDDWTATVAFHLEAIRTTERRVMSIEDERAAIQDQTEDIRTNSEIQRAAGPIAEATLKHKQKMVKIQRDFNVAVSELDPVNRDIGVQLLQDQVKALNEVGLRDFKDRLAEIEVEKFTQQINEMSAAVSHSAGVMGSMSPKAAVMHQSLGEGTKIWAEYGASSDKSNKAVFKGLAATGAAMAPALAAFVDNKRTQAGIMSAFELAQGFANLDNPFLAGAHFTASALFAGVATGLISTSGAASSGGRGLAGTPGGFKVPGGGGDGPSQIVINFTDGMILGDPQSIAQKINEALDQASGTGAPAGV
tara:strand:- start:92 stop:2587 length:2496 start_codon:yes stop_codon:yes gene_type:complete